MAELNRQLQEYLSQSKSGGTKSSSSTLVEVGEPEAVPGSWFGRWSSPWSGQSSAGSSGSSWPWSSEPDPCLPGVSRQQRLLGFGVCLGLSVLCFGLSALYAPLLLLYARKFALLWTLGSLFAVAAVSVLRGPSKLLSGLHRSPGAAAYLCALAGTLYAALGLHSTVLTALGAGLQGALLLGGLLALLPGGSAGIRYLSGWTLSVLKRTVSGRTMAI
ncbi:vesicle transport protein SFT2C-like [Cyprinodon tularosa]|uniref:Vesicle transport protein n=1 Tax=Cyprinodon variegatus TaxID=28743 RepID=A0A3Q2EBE2_CYPVA|nr:PREDICTED: vesicle transport protein SFT2C [Cyprinodon variegatus]XP_038137368.1 vesicle transport protein SFT2C-like [Cyprinodon tularosa]